LAFCIHMTSVLIDTPDQLVVCQPQSGSLLDSARVALLLPDDVCCCGTSAARWLPGAHVVNDTHPGNPNHTDSCSRNNSRPESSRSAARGVNVSCRSSAGDSASSASGTATSLCRMYTVGRMVCNRRYANHAEVALTAVMSPNQTVRSPSLHGKIATL
jgi:hypothetical protein